MLLSLSFLKSSAADAPNVGSLVLIVNHWRRMLSSLADYSKNMRAITVTWALVPALQLWLKFCMQYFLSKATDAIALKLHTLTEHHHMTLQDKSHNTRL